MGEVKAPEVPQPKRGLTDFEQKLVDILFLNTRTKELPVERLFDVAIAISDELTRDVIPCRVQVNGMNERYLLLHNPVIDDNTLNEGDNVKLIIAKED